MPKRIQRRRTKGWRKPEGAKYTGRGTMFGNQHKLSMYTPEEAVRLYKYDIDELGYAGRVPVGEVPALLGGLDLMCFCPLDQPCHNDPLLELANPEP